MSNNTALLARLSSLPPIAGLAGSVAGALGRTEAQLADPDLTTLLGFHVVLNDNLLAVYLLSDRVFGLYETTPEGRDFTLTVSTARLRRVAKLEDLGSTRVIIEIDADRAVTRAVTTESGATENQVVPAGYEITEADPDRRELLRSFHRAAAAAVGF